MRLVQAQTAGLGQGGSLGDELLEGELLERELDEEELEDDELMDSEESLLDDSELSDDSELCEEGEGERLERELLDIPDGLPEAEEWLDAAGSDPSLVFEVALELSTDDGTCDDEGSGGREPWLDCGAALELGGGDGEFDEETHGLTLDTRSISLRIIKNHKNVSKHSRNQQCRNECRRRR